MICPRCDYETILKGGSLDIYEYICPNCLCVSYLSKSGIKKIVFNIKNCTISIWYVLQPETVIVIDDKVYMRTVAFPINMVKFLTLDKIKKLSLFT
jgi:hypothetical protein